MDDFEGKIYLYPVMRMMERRWVVRQSIDVAILIVYHVLVVRSVPLQLCYCYCCCYSMMMMIQYDDFVAVVVWVSTHDNQTKNVRSMDPRFVFLTNAIHVMQKCVE